MAGNEKKIISIPQFDKDKYGFETMDEFEMSANFRILNLETFKEGREYNLRNIPSIRDKGDSAVVGEIGD